LQDKEKRYTCENPKCKQTFDTPKLVQHYVCPFCATEVKKRTSEDGCLHYFGYLGQREKGEPIPSECVECRKSIECMLSTMASKDAVKEIKKWY